MAAKRVDRHESRKEKKAGQRHGIADNMLYVMRESWRSARGLFLAMLLMVVMQVIHTVCATYTDKLVVEFVLGA